MALYKSAQHNDILDIDDEIKNLGDHDEVIIYEEKPSEDDVIEMHNPEEAEISFKLPHLPGCDEVPLEVSTDEVSEKHDKHDKEDKNEVKEITDPWDYKSYKPKDYNHWIKFVFDNIPKHSGRDTTGIERVISYFKKFDGDISKAIANDYRGEANISLLENARRESYHAIDRLTDALNRLDETHYKKKKADFAPEIVKEAKQTHVGGIIVTVPLLISEIAKVCINGMVSGGHDIEKLCDDQIKEYGLNKREQTELLGLLTNMGYGMPRRDRGFPKDHHMDPKSLDNRDFGVNWPS